MIALNGDDDERTGEQLGALLGGDVDPLDAAALGEVKRNVRVVDVDLETPRNVTLHPTGIPSRSLNPAMDFLDLVMTGA